MTEEERVSYFLRDWYNRHSDVIIHSWHPPCGKTYEAALIRIPKLGGEARSRKRYHIDFILQIGPILILQELKGAGHELANDVEKLRDIVATYSVDRLKKVMGQRVADVGVLEAATTLLPSIAHSAPAIGDLEPEFLRVVTDGAAVSVDFGSSVGTATRRLVACALA